MIWRTQATQAFADALAGRRPAKGEVAELVALATRLCEIAAETEPTPEFRTALRTRLMTSAETVRVVTRTAPKVWSMRRRTAVVAALIATTFGGAGMAAASASTIPGDTLYPVKRAIENSQLAFKYSDSSRGEFHLQLATERLTEVNDLASSPGSSQQTTEDTFAEFQRQANMGSEALMRSYLANDSRGDLAVLNRFSASSARQLSELRGHLSVADLLRAQQLLDGLAVQSTRMCPNCQGSIAVDSAARSTIAPTDAPTTRSSATAASPTVSASASPTSASIQSSTSPTPAASSSASSSPVPVQLPESSLQLPESSLKKKTTPPVADLVKKTVEVPTKPIQDMGIVQDLTGHDGKLLKLPTDR